MAKLWGGRFEGATDQVVERLNNSLPYDRRLWREDIAGSIAHATMLGEAGIIPDADSSAIVSGLKRMAEQLERGDIVFDPAQEDVHSAVEALLREQIGPVAGKLHTARSRNDQVATDIRLWLRAAVDEVDSALEDFQGTLLRLAADHLDNPTLHPAPNPQSPTTELLSTQTPERPNTQTPKHPNTQTPKHLNTEHPNTEHPTPTILPGCTHLQHGQPVLLSHHLLAYFWMFLRDRERLADARARINRSPLGAGALAGTTFPIQRERVADLLEFEGICENSLDAVSDRDFAIEFLAAASLIMVHCSRLAEEIILWNSREYRFVALGDSVTTGSSIMPQKKNPDVAELARGKSGRVFGSLLGLLVVMKGLPLAYNKDMQEDKEPLFDTVDTLLTLLPALEKTLATATFNAARMRESLRGDFSTATDIADRLVRKGVPFRDAHHAAGRIVRYCEERGIGLEELSAEALWSLAPDLNGDPEALATIEASVSARAARGGTAPETVRRQLDYARAVWERLRKPAAAES